MMISKIGKFLMYKKLALKEEQIQGAYSEEIIIVFLNSNMSHPFPGKEHAHNEESLVNL